MDSISTKRISTSSSAKSALLRFCPLKFCIRARTLSSSSIAALCASLILALRSLTLPLPPVPVPVTCSSSVRKARKDLFCFFW